MQNSGRIILNATKSRTTLSSPNYPKSYTNNMDLQFVIQAAENKVIKVEIEYVDIEKCGTSGCHCDQISLKDESQPKAKFFKFQGQNKLCNIGCDFDVITSSTNQITVNFTTDGSVTSTGWSMSYWAVPKSSTNTATKYEVQYSIECAPVSTGTTPSSSGQEGENGNKKKHFV